MAEKKLIVGKKVKTNLPHPTLKHALREGVIHEIIETTKGDWFAVNLGTKKDPEIKKFRAASLVRL